MKHISLIVAHGRNLEIGSGNDMPWGRTLKADLRHFKETTGSSPLLMGRKTAASLRGPLPGRACFVLTHHPETLADGFIPVESVEEWLRRAEPAEEGFVIGGASVYAQALPHVDQLYVTRVDAAFPEADTFFPAIDESQWTLESVRPYPAGPDAAHELSFEIWRRA